MYNANADTMANHFLLVTLGGFLVLTGMLLMVAFR